MTIYVTQKQYNLLKRMLPVMRAFYQNDIRPLFEEIAKQYGTTEEDVVKAADIFYSVPVTAACQKDVSELTTLIDEVKKAKNIHIESSDVLRKSPFVKTIHIPDDAKSTLIDALDTYSRVLMGQFFIIYEQLDVNTQNPHIEEAWSDAKWGGINVREMRDVLIPELKCMEWNGSYGIAGKDNKYDSKLSYEMLKVIRKRRDDYILRVTDQPLLIVDEF